MLLPNLRIIRGDPPLGAGIPARMNALLEFGCSMISPYQEVIFTRLEDGTTEISYATYPVFQGLLYNNTKSHFSLIFVQDDFMDDTGHLRFMQSLMAIEVLSGEDTGTYFASTTICSFPG